MGHPGLIYGDLGHTQKDAWHHWYLQELSYDLNASLGERLSASGIKRATNVGNVGQFIRALAANKEAAKRLITNHYDYPDFPGSGYATLMDHVLFYKRDRKPAAVISHPYCCLNGTIMGVLADWSRETGIEVWVDGNSEYYPTRTIRIILYKKGTEPKHGW